MHELPICNVFSRHCLELTCLLSSKGGIYQGKSGQTKETRAMACPMQRDFTLIEIGAPPEGGKGAAEKVSHSFRS
jgi:hypothetical protein